MRNETIIRKIVNHILLNACSVNSSGLYNGKAGMALALFEAARYLQDDYVEEQAFELLQESLITKIEDISLENGLAGIGYVLLYLIHNNYIEADFHELFGEQHEKILKGVYKSIENTNIMRINYYLSEVKRHTSGSNQLNELTNKIFQSVESNLLSQFSCFTNLHNGNNKIAVLSKFECYLKAARYCNYTEVSLPLLDDYAHLYRNGRIKSSFPIACYLEMLGMEHRLSDVIRSNKQFENIDSTLRHASLRSIIEYSHLSGDEGTLTTIISEEELGNAILKHIPKGAFIAGYEQGLSRLLFYLTNNNSIFIVT